MGSILVTLLALDCDIATTLIGTLAGGAPLVVRIAQLFRIMTDPEPV